MPTPHSIIEEVSCPWFSVAQLAPRQLLSNVLHTFVTFLPGKDGVEMSPVLFVKSRLSPVSSADDDFACPT